MTSWITPSLLLSTHSTHLGSDGQVAILGRVWQAEGDTPCGHWTPEVLCQLLSLSRQGAAGMTPEHSWTVNHWNPVNDSCLILTWDGTGQPLPPLRPLPPPPSLQACRRSAPPW
jgi:hypothetical protein